MERRSFLRRTGATVAGAAAAASTARAPAVASDTRELKMVTTWPENFPGLGTSAQRLADRITRMSGGRLKVKLYAAGDLVPAFEAFDAVRNKTAEMYHGAEYYWVGSHKAFAFFSAVPFGFTAPEMSAWLHHGGGQELWDELSAEFGLKAFPAANTGVQMGGWFREPVTSLEDMKGLRFRMPGLGGDVMREIGVSVVNKPGGELFTALQSGNLDGTEWVGPWNDLAFGFYKITKHYYWPGMHEPGTVLSMGMNRDIWDSLSDSDKAIVEAATQAEHEYSLAEFNARNNDALQTLINEHGVQLHQMPDEVMRKLGDAAGDVLAGVAESDPMTKKVYDSYMAFREKALAWSRRADFGYMRARDLDYTYR